MQWIRQIFNDLICIEFVVTFINKTTFDRSPPARAVMYETKLIQMRSELNQQKKVRRII